MGDPAAESASRDQWSGSAAAWRRAADEAETGASADMATWMLEAAGLQPGQRVLELAAGAGRVGLQAAAAVGDEGSVLCTDFAAPMVEAIRERVAALGVRNVEAREADAQEIEFAEGDRFDVVLCRNGFMLMADPATALRRAHGALVPGGRLCLGVWGTAQGNPWLTSILAPIMAHFGAPDPPPGTPGPFSLADPDRVTALLDEAGFGEPLVERRPSRQPYPTADAWWDHVLAVSGPIKALLDAMAAGDAAAIRAQAMAAAERFTRADGAVDFDAEIVVARALR